LNTGPKTDSRIGGIDEVYLSVYCLAGKLTVRQLFAEDISRPYCPIAYLYSLLQMLFYKDMLLLLRLLPAVRNIASDDIPENSWVNWFDCGCQPVMDSAGILPFTGDTAAAAA